MTAGQLRELFREMQQFQRPTTNSATLKKKVGVDELCELFGFKKSTVYYWASTKFIPHKNVRRRLKFDVDEINTWIEKFNVKTKEDYLK